MFKVLELPPGPMNNGVFGPWDACPKGYFAVGFRVRSSRFRGNIHVMDKRNMGVSAVHLLCEQPSWAPGEEHLRWRPMYLASNEVGGTMLGCCSTQPILVPLELHQQLRH